MKVSVVTGVCYRFDAISESVVGTIRAITDRLQWPCRLFTYASDFEELDTTLARGVADVVLDPYFNASDIIIYHFGIYYELFNATLLGNGRARQIVYYHNITPKQYLPQTSRSIIERSLRQSVNLEAADWIWTPSKFNRDGLIAFGIAADRIKVMPLYVKPRFAPAWRMEKSPTPIRLITVGRFVTSKGLTDLVRAVAIARSLTDIAFIIDFIGITQYSDDHYIAEVKTLCERLAIADIAGFGYGLSDEELGRRYNAAHIFISASYHEGFCVPVIEAMHARCLPIVYNSGNLPSLVGGHGEIVDCGDYQELGRQLAKHIAFFDRYGRGQDSLLPLSAGAIALEEYDDRVEDYVAGFAYGRFVDRVAAALLRTASTCGASQ